MIANLLFGVILIVLSILGWVFKPFTYWWIASIVIALIGIVIALSAFRKETIV